MVYTLEILPLDEKDEAKRKRQIVENPKGCIVLVHGICHGAWCWENFINFFADHDYQCYAISLPGHGGSKGKEQLQEYCLSDYVEAVKEAMGTIKEDMKAHGLSGVKPFLLGHSMGGAVVQQYIGKCADTVQGAVLFAPATAPKMTRCDVLPKNLHLWFATCIAWDIRNRFPTFGNSREQVVHDAAFFSSRDENGNITQRVKDTSRFVPLLQEESKKVTGGKCALVWPGDLGKRYSDNYCVHIPVFVIGSRADLYFPQKSLKKTASKYAGNGKTALVILKRLCHDMMLDDEEWEESAKPVLEFVKDPITFVNAPENHWPRE